MAFNKDKQSDSAKSHTRRTRTKYMVMTPCNDFGDLDVQVTLDSKQDAVKYANDYSHLHKKTFVYKVTCVKVVKQ